MDVVEQAEKIMHARQKHWMTCAVCGTSIFRSTLEAVPCLFCGAPLCKDCDDTGAHECGDNWGDDLQKETAQ